MLDYFNLLHAPPENVARLARALRVDLPPIPDGAALEAWSKRAATDVERAILMDRHRAAQEHRDA